MVSIFGFHRSDGVQIPVNFHNDNHYIIVPSINPMCHPSEWCRPIPIEKGANFLFSRCILTNSFITHATFPMSGGK